MAVIRRKKQEITPSLDRVDEMVKHAIDRGLGRCPAGVESLVRLSGINIKRIPMGSEHVGYLRRTGSKWEVGVNALFHPRRQRHIIAHNLGHFLMHRELYSSFENPMLSDRKNFSKIEIEASDFAMELLMPKSEFRDFVKNVSGQVSKVSDRFEVSGLAVRIRARDLGFKGHSLPSSM